MSTIEELIHARRSVRSFSDRPVGDDLVARILSCGHAAPSAGNLKAWRFIIIRDPQQKERVVRSTYCRNSEANPPQRWLMNAPVLIAVVCDLSVMTGRYGRHGIDSLVYLDCACAVENMLLCAAHLGLSSCFVSGFREHELGEALGLPAQLEAVALLPLGYANQAVPARPSCSAREVTFFERWDSPELRGG